MLWAISVCVLFAIIPQSSARNCIVNPTCSCPSSTVNCTTKFGYDLPKFATNSYNFNLVEINGNRNIRRTPQDAFDGLSTRQLYIHGTGMFIFGCTAFKGLSSNLETLVLSDNWLSSVPSCSFQYSKGITRLDLQSNNISSLQTGAFENLKNLKYLNLDGNRIEKIIPEAFEGLVSLDTLSIQRNNLSILEGNIFNELVKLKQMDLSSNYISTIHPKAFEGMENLNTLDLSYNSINVLDHTGFQGILKLATLNINNNKLSEIHEKLFSGLAGLKYVYIDHNNLRYIPDSLFETNPNIATLNLSGQNISAISLELAKTLGRISRLYISDNMLTTIQEDVFRNLFRLISLDISGNRIENILTGVFKNLPSLDTLDLSRNRIENMQPKSFENLPNLSVLNVSDNRIGNIQPGVFRNLPRLETLDLSRNRIERLQTDLFQNLSTLSNLDLSWNQIFEIQSSSFRNVASISNLNLAHNEVAFIENGTFPNLKRLNLSSNIMDRNSLSWLVPLSASLLFIHLDLSNNPVGNVPHLVIEQLDGVFNLSLKNISLTDIPTIIVPGYRLDLSFNKFDSDSVGPIIFRKSGISYVPYEHDIYVLNLTNSLISSLIPIVAEFPIFAQEIDLSHNKLTRIDRFPLFHRQANYRLCESNLTVDSLNLSYNRISLISPSSCLGTVVSLDLSHNLLSSLMELVPKNISSKIFRLKSLNLAWNQIHQIEPQTVINIGASGRIDLTNNRIQNLETLKTVLQGTAINSLSLSDNPMHCDCQSSWLRRPPFSSKVILARCETPLQTRDYLAACYPLTQCSSDQQLDSQYTPWEICDSDVMVTISNMSVVARQRQLHFWWNRTGPGEITGYKIDFRPSEEASSSSGRVVIHPSKTEMILNDVFEGVLYNVCVSAVIDSRTVSKTLCSTGRPDGQISINTVIGLSIPLAICLLSLTVLFVLYVVWRRRRSRKTTEDSPKDNIPVTPPTLPYYLSPEDPYDTVGDVNEGYEDPHGSK